MKKLLMIALTTLSLAACQTTGPVDDDNPPRVITQKNAQQVSAYLAKEFRAQGYTIKTQNNQKLVATRLMEPTNKGQKYYAARSNPMPYHKLKVNYKKTTEGLEVIGWTGILMNPGTSKQFDFSINASADGRRMQSMLYQAAR